MEITEVRIKLMEDSDDRLQAFCSITFDNCFVVRDLKIIEGSNGAFVAMPSRKLTSHCSKCGAKNHLRAAHCNGCGKRLGESRMTRDADGRTKLYADIAHPINSQCREMIQQRVISEYEAELVRSQEPGYVSRYDEDYGDAGPEDTPDPISTTSSSSPPNETRSAAEVRSTRIDDVGDDKKAPLQGPHKPQRATQSSPPATHSDPTNQAASGGAPAQPNQPNQPSSAGDEDYEDGGNAESEGDDKTGGFGAGIFDE